MDHEITGNSPSIWTQLKLLSEWSPLLAFGQSFIGTPDPHAKALILADAAEWCARKTETKVDDELIGLLSAVLASPQGEALLRWGVEKVHGEA